MMRIQNLALVALGVLLLAGCRNSGRGPLALWPSPAARYPTAAESSIAASPTAPVAAVQSPPATANVNQTPTAQVASLSTWGGNEWLGRPPVESAQNQSPPISAPFGSASAYPSYTSSSSSSLSSGCKDGCCPR